MICGASQSQRGHQPLAKAGLGPEFERWIGMSCLQDWQRRMRSSVWRGAWELPLWAAVFILRPRAVFSYLVRQSRMFAKMVSVPMTIPCASLTLLIQPFASTQVPKICALPVHICPVIEG